MAVLEASRNVDDLVESGTKLFAPIVRYGAIIAATVDRGRMAFRYAKLSDAIVAVEHHREEYLKASIDLLSRHGWTVVDPFANDQLSKFRVNRRLGAVIDFDELLISRDGERHVIRFCVTVCVDTRGELRRAGDSACAELDGDVCYLGPDSKVRLYSKIWLRSSCLEYNHKPAADLNFDEHAEMYREFGEIFDELVGKALKPSYKLSLSEMVNVQPTDISIDVKFTISNFTVSLEDAGFSHLYQTAAMDALTWGEPGWGALPPVAKNSAVAMQRLRDAFHETENEADFRLMRFDNSTFARALFWITTESNSMQIIGIANNPFENADSFTGTENSVSWKGAPSNALGVIATSKFASRM